MLKIKDNIDLKELEKFGFELTEKEWYETRDNDIWVMVTPISKTIKLSTNSNGIREIDGILYDLIKADLVEKVDSNER